jgi:hypothetical protein
MAESTPTRLAPDEAMALMMVMSHPCPLIQAQI